MQGGYSDTADVTGNTVTVTGGIINNTLKGGQTSGSHNVSSNTVKVSGNASVNEVYGGFLKEGTGEAANNIVEVSGGTIENDVYGSYVYHDTEVPGNTATATVKSNTVNIWGGEIKGTVFGGFAEQGNADSNQVNMTSGTASTGDGKGIIGGYTQSGDALSNSVLILGGQAGTVRGGQSESGNVSHNAVSITGTVLATTSVREVVGGWIDNARTDKSATGNTVTINVGADVIGSVFGGYILAGAGAVGGVGDEKGNQVTVNSGTISGNVAGGWTTGSGAAVNNTLTVVGGVINNDIFGGYSEGGTASSNHVILNGGTISGEVHGGATSGNGAIENNDVTLAGATVKNNIVGGVSANGNANNNSVTVSSGSVVAEEETKQLAVVGGRAFSAGEANSNTVIINGGQVEIVRGGQSKTGNVSDNTVTISGTSDAPTKVGEIVGGWVDDSGNGTETAKRAKGNAVTINEGAEVAGNVYGAIVKKGTGAAANNTVTVNGGMITGGIDGGLSGEGNASYNQVNISGGTVNGDIHGGDANETSDHNKIVITGGKIGGKVIGGVLSVASATDNSVSIENATIDGNVYGGVTSNGSATNNLITLTGGNVKISGTIYGGFIDNSTRASGDVVTGNTLKFVHFRGDIAGIENVQNYNWVLPKDVVNGETLVHITGTNAVDLANTSHVVALENDGNRLNVGDKVTLIDKTVNGEAIANMRVTQGNFLIYDMKAEQKENGYVLTAQNRTGDDNNSGTTTGGGTSGGDTTGGSTSGGGNNNGTTTGGGTNGGDTTGGSNNSGTTPGGSTSGSDTNGGSAGSNEFAGRLNPQTKAFSEGGAAALGFLNQGSDLIANSGIRAARSSVAEGGKNPWQMNLMPFFVIDGSSNRYKTGSHADVDGFNMAVGLATGFDLADKHPVTLGAFFEYGRGTYDTYNSFATYASVHGDGDTHYTGGGILGRIDFAGTGLGLVNKLEDGQADGLYAEASFRAGHIDSDFDTDDLLGSYGEDSKYDSGADYYGLHGGIGYVMNFDERNSVDVYGRYLWTKIDSETVDVGRDRLHFDEAESSRQRIGTRYTMIYNDQLKPYVGVAYEHEFDGEVAAHAYGLKLDKPSLEGDTGVFEAGVSMKSLSTVKALSVDVNGQGFIGRREGGGGGIKIKYQF